MIEVYNSVGDAPFLRRLGDEWRRHGWVVNYHQARSSADYRRTREWFGRLWMRWRMYGDLLIRFDEERGATREWTPHAS